jgi:putative Ca2+/H+ antiporter (TMEM165/GDT1 family)
MNIEIIAVVFAVIFIAELPDKSLFASLVLGSRFPGWYVWLGAATAFLVHVVIAVTAGKLLTFLPHKVLEIVITLIFLAGAFLLFFGKHGLEDDNEKHASVAKNDAESGFWKVYMTSFGVVFLGEWGDITQIATANYAAKYHNPWSVGLGAILALWAVTALAITVGTKALSLIPPKVLHRTTGSILLIFALLTGYSAIR